MKRKTPLTINFPIVDIEEDAPMKYIPPSALPTFNGLSTKDPNTFLFEFDVSCRSYDYVSDAQKLKLFPATSKGAALPWFMGLGGQTILTWDDMKQKFLQKYQAYCKMKLRGNILNDPSRR